MKIIINNLAVEYEDEGQGPVILFLHGWMDNLRTFDALVPGLSNRWRVIRLDLQGFGGSEIPKQPWTVGEYADFVRSFCEKVGFQPEVLVGHSFGGRVAIKGIAGGILHLRKLILVASAGLAKHRTVKALLFLLAAKLGKVGLFFLPQGIHEYFRKKLYGMAGSWDYARIQNETLKKTFLKAIQEDLSNAARRVSVPTLLIWGSHDVITPLWDGKRLQTLIAGSKLEIIPGAAHFVHQEKPEKVTDLIKQFLSI